METTTRHRFVPPETLQVSVDTADGVKELLRCYTSPKMNAKTTGAPLTVGGAHLKRLVGLQKAPPGALRVPRWRQTDWKMQMFKRKCIHVGAFLFANVDKKQVNSPGGGELQ